MGTWEWPLIVFTVLSQISIGIIVGLLGLDCRNQLKEKLFKQGVVVSGILLMIALLASLFHLGHPEAAYRAITHLGSSWLSREILFFILTFVGWLYLLWLSFHPAGKLRSSLLITSVLGLLGIISSAMIYVLPRVPAWNNVAPVFFFILTAGLLGALALVILGGKELQPEQKKSLLNWALGCIIVSIFMFVLYASTIKVNAQGAATVQFLLSSPLFWLRAGLGWLAPLILLLIGLKSQKVFTASTLYLVFALVGVGEILGRALFYVSAVGIHISALF
ncbi:dimethyl sulfoxide reductase anchor subunit family protein [Desulfosporosinus hippei]|uniref:Anaerobic dimethyl sulfoxide reductase subunit C (DMSO reductase anchor subunit) n=1 Tax=Desulfosporosinus hippei DSM 8344 TaxID=1121419 RepID=A0A1G7UG99_9FIRM|nr:DmsC/YnfH family molybdoenzyme membrane anchor subunit [Desulfosporosinus hippei]SDG46348.1 anaerobic dimethyl sulfoxide reductase subunit C (DMSO reductase anchor subunit) [Desulfosporosinus hippei DSM 8344]